MTARDGSNILPPEFSDDGLALGFSDKHAGELLYVPAWSRWLRWDGMRWKQDNTLAVFDLARGFCREMAVNALATPNSGGPARADAITSASTIAAVERLARSDPRHARRAEDFDADPWALNTPRGVLDLRTGELRPPTKADMLTKLAGAAPGGDCPRWLRFLHEITHGDTELIAYLQRFVGYTLLGIIPEHAFLFLIGPGKNGKSVLLSTVAKLLGDYAVTAMADTFTVNRNESHPTHLASLRGARMVWVPETESGSVWAEARLKALTAGDKISARVMRGDPFEFTPTFTLWVAGNHRPELRNPDDAMRRRMHMAPLTFVPEKPDLKLTDALAAELPGIMEWAMAGCMTWQREGLKPPAVVTEAVGEYFEQQDALAQWFEERCERDPMGEIGSRALYQDWSGWTKAIGRSAGSEVKFSEAMQKHAAKKRNKKGMVFVGVKLLPADPGAWA